MVNDNLMLGTTQVVVRLSFNCDDCFFLNHRHSAYINVNTYAE